MKSLSEEVGGKAKIAKIGKIKAAPKLQRKKLAHWQLALIIAGGVIVAGGAAAAVLLNLGGKPTQIQGEMQKPTSAAAREKYYSPLTGREVANAGLTKRAVTAVMVENSPEARPQSGLKDAGVVFEAVAEGGITRFIALYQEAEPSLVGPVRSARPYFLEWALAFDPAVVHVGGSDEALQMLQSGNYGLDVNEVSGGPIFRSKDRAAPHNAYTNFANYSAYETAHGKTASTFAAWPRQDGAASSAPDAASIDLAPSTGQFSVHYDYDAASNTYKRSEGGAPHLDRELGQIAPDVVIALRVQQGLMADGLHSIFQTTGSGDAYVFQNGTVAQVQWSRAAASDMLKFTDASGAEIKLNRGQVWLTAVGQGRNISWQ